MSYIYFFQQKIIFPEWVLKIILLFISLGFLAGCSVGPPYKSPCIEVPSEWKNKQTDGQCCETAEDRQSDYLDHWWEVFEDENLDNLEDWAIENNRNLFVAFEKVQEYRALMGIAAADLYPQINLSPTYTNTGELIKNYVNPNSPLNTPGIGQPFRVHELFYFLPIVLSYEVDLWGKIRDQYHSAKYLWQAEQKDYESVMLSLTSSLATVYFQLRALDSQIDLLLSILKTRQKAYKINLDRYEEKIIFYADVALAAEEVDSARLQYHEVIRQRKVLENQIAVLIGVPSSEFCLEHLPLEGLPPCIPAGLPTEVLLRRPDLVEAEFQTRAAHAMVKQAYAQFFPSLVLTTTGGYESPILKDFIQTISRYWMLGAEANQIIFDGLRTPYNLKLQITRFLEATGDTNSLFCKLFKR